jgi:hypothetical protein
VDDTAKIMSFEMTQHCWDGLDKLKITALAAGCTIEQFVAAVDRVGIDPVLVAQELHRKHCAGFASQPLG